MLGLRYPFISVTAGGRLSYGGSQTRSDKAVIRRCGCGPVAALDTILYLERHGDGGPLAQSDYNEMLTALCSRYFPLLPPFGINGFVFTVGMNRLLSARGLPYRAIWMVSGAKLWPRVEEMLGRDLPVILSVGPNFPAFWHNKRLPFYVKTADGTYRRATATKGHFVTATGIDADWVRISSWGREYFINRSEYERYTKENSCYLFSNLLYLQEIR